MQHEIIAVSIQVRSEKILHMPQGGHRLNDPFGLLLARVRGSHVGKDPLFAGLFIPFMRLTRDYGATEDADQMPKSKGIRLLIAIGEQSILDEPFQAVEQVLVRQDDRIPPSKYLFLPS
jgi:hypothetical protein